jgi:hypothetical protein
MNTLLGLLYLQDAVKSLPRGFFNTSASAGLLYSCPNTKFPHSSPEAPRIMRMRETSTSEGGNYPPPQFCQRILILKISAVIFYMPQSWDMGHIILLPFRRKAGFEPANSGSSGQYANH